jgi:hypothetical protein
MKFGIDIDHPLSWQLVQELAHVLNYLSVDEHLPTSFFPVSPPPYMNGGPKQYLSWVIECSDKTFEPKTAARWLEGRLPSPVNELSTGSSTIDDIVDTRLYGEALRQSASANNFRSTLKNKMGYCMHDKVKYIP